MASEREKDLTPQEAREKIVAFLYEVGPKAILEVNLQLRGRLYRGYFRPEGHVGDVYAFVEGETYREVIDAASAKWAELADAHTADMIRRMALKIIELTADLGECTDAALRAEFDDADITRFGALACERATEMGSKGPFSIVRLAGANDREAA